jgi:hypothetical protein
MTAGNDVFIRGLPFAASGSGIVTYQGACLLQSITLTSAVDVICSVVNGSLYGKISKNISGSSSDNILVSNLSSTVSQIFATVTYEV